MSFYNGKHKKEIRALTCSVVTALMIFMTVYPNLIYGPWNITGFFKNYFDFHTVFFHNVVIFEFILIIVLRLHHIEHSKKNIKTIALFGAGFSAAAGIMSQLLQTNYAKFLNCNDIPPLADFH
jgi:ABC-type Fe3+-siderophore transport system permease subunit